MRKKIVEKIATKAAGERGLHSVEPKEIDPESAGARLSSERHARLGVPRRGTGTVRVTRAGGSRPGGERRSAPRTRTRRAAQIAALSNQA